MVRTEKNKDVEKTEVEEKENMEEATEKGEPKGGAQSDHEAPAPETPQQTGRNSTLLLRTAEQHGLRSGGRPRKTYNQYR